MKLNQIDNTAFKAKYLYVGERKNLDKVAKECQEHKDKETLFLRYDKNDVLLVATSNDAKILRKSKETPNFKKWLDSLKCFGSLNWIENICKFIFKTNQGVAICQADKSLEPADKINEGEIYFIDKTKLFVHDKKGYAKQFDDGRIEYYTEEGKVKTIEYPNGKREDNFYNSSCKDLLFTRITEAPKNYINPNNTKIISQEGIPDYREETVTFIKPNGSIIVYDFEGKVIKTDNIKEADPLEIFKKN